MYLFIYYLIYIAKISLRDIYTFLEISLEDFIDIGHSSDG